MARERGTCLSPGYVHSPETAADSQNRATGLRLYRWELTRSVTWHRGSQNQFLVDYLHRLQINRDNKQVASHLQFLRSTYMGTGT
jgi:hypothetical protein